MGLWAYRLTISGFMTVSSLQVEDRGVNSLVSRHHGLDRKALLDAPAAGVAIDFRKPFQGTHGLLDVVYQKPRPPVFDHLAAGAQVHGDNRHTRGIRFSQHQSEPLRDSVQME